MLYCYPNDCTGTVNNIYLHNFPNSVFDKNRSVNKFGDTFVYMNIIHIKTDINYIPFPGTDQYQKYSYVSFDNVRPSSEKSVVADFVGAIANDVMETQKSIIVVCRNGVN
jgi:hypothetical protein